MPYAFTEQGIAMLSSVLKSKTAVEVNIRIMRTFVYMRRFIATNAQLFQRLEAIEYNQLEMKQHQDMADKRIDEVFKRLDANVLPKQGIFYDGQVFDAYRFVSDLIRKAKCSIVLIDNYLDDTVLTLLDKREQGVSATVYTQRISGQLQLDVDRHNVQYPLIEIKRFNKAHDRFLFIDVGLSPTKNSSIKSETDLSFLCIMYVVMDKKEFFCPLQCAFLDKKVYFCRWRTKR